MRESLAKLKAALEQEKRLNASIKQKKVGSDKLYLSTDFCRHAFSYSSPVTWNSIPTSIKNNSSLYSFKRHIKSHLIAQLINN